MSLRYDAVRFMLGLLILAGAAPGAAHAATIAESFLLGKWTRDRDCGKPFFTFRAASAQKIMDADGKMFSTNFPSVSYDYLDDRSVRINFHAEHGVGRVKSKTELIVDLIDQRQASIRVDRGRALVLDRCPN